MTSGLRSAASAPARPDSGPRWRSRFHIALASLFAVRLVYAWTVPLDLVGDEAYYWDWGRHLAWGYYSKPPLIAWLMAAASWIGGGTPAALRTVAVLLGCGTLAFSHALARELYDERVAFWAAAAIAATPGNAVSSLILTVDAPLLFFWSAALYCLWRTLVARDRRPRAAPGPAPRASVAWALPLIGAVGLGLLTKQMMIVFVALALLFVAGDPRLRRHLARPWIYLGSAVSLGFLVPVLHWNSRHDWITFRHTAHHFDGGGSGGIAARLGAFVVEQMALTSPLLWLPLVALCIAGLYGLRRSSRRERFLLLFSGLPLLAMCLMTVRQELNANWPAPFYLAGLLLLAGRSVGQVDAGSAPPRLGRWFLPGIASAAALSLLVCSIPFVLPATRLAGGPRDPTARLRGWAELGASIGEISAGMRDPGRTFIVTLGHRYTTSELAFYTPGRPPVVRFTGATAVESQYELWPGPEELRGWDALIVADAGRAELPAELLASFESVEPARRLRIPLGPGSFREYRVHRAHAMSHWPER